MTEARKIDVSKQFGKTNTFQLDRIAEAVNLLQGIGDPDQRAVRAFELRDQIADIEARLTKAGF